MNETSPLTPRGLERRLKRHWMKRRHDLFAIVERGFEDELLAEVLELPGAEGASGEPGGVAFAGPLDLVYRANLRLRTAHRVLLRIDESLAQSYPMLFDHARKIPWELHVGFRDRMAIDVSATQSRLRHKRNIARTLLSAAQARLEPLERSVDLDAEAPLRFQARIHQDRCTVSSDTSGVHLHRRGYRTHVGPAPMRETLAAAVLAAVGSERFDVIHDPFCGSGTLVLEAAARRARVAPGSGRSFGFEAAPWYQSDKWARIREEAIGERIPLDGVRLVGTDIDEAAVQAARSNAQRLGVGNDVSFGRIDARKFEYASLARDPARALVVSNLPYGERIGGTGVAEVLTESLTRIRRGLPGAAFAFVTTHPHLLTEAGLRIESTRGFRNGGLRVVLATGILPS